MFGYCNSCGYWDALDRYTKRCDRCTHLWYDMRAYRRVPVTSREVNP